MQVPLLDLLWVLPSSNRRGSRVPPSSCLSWLKLHPQQQQQIYPKHVHKMPVARRRIQRTFSQDRLIQSANHTHQPAQPAKHVQGMHCRQHVEERAVGIRGQVKSLGTQLQPGEVLAEHEKQSKEQRDIQPARWVRDLTSSPAHEGSYLATRHLQRNATGQEYKGVEIKNSGEDKLPTIQSRPLPNNQGAGERQEGHRDRGQHDPDSG